MSLVRRLFVPTIAGITVLACSPAETDGEGTSNDEILGLGGGETEDCREKEEDWRDEEYIEEIGFDPRRDSAELDDFCKEVASHAKKDEDAAYKVCLSFEKHYVRIVTYRALSRMKKKVLGEDAEPETVFSEIVDEMVNDDEACINPDAKMYCHEMLGNGACKKIATRMKFGSLRTLRNCLDAGWGWTAVSCAEAGFDYEDEE